MVKRILNWQRGLILRLLVGGIFIYAGLIKVMNPAQFAGDIDQYRLLPWGAAVLGAVYLPWLEILCATLLVIGRWCEGALLILLGLMGVFVIALISAWMRKLDITCGCFGHGNGEGVAQYPLWLARDLILAGLLGILVKQYFFAENSPHRE